MKEPFFSIIIPTLNEEKCIPRLLNCLVKQKCQDFEVIIVDGGSTDTTKEKVFTFLSLVPHLSWYSVGKQNVSYQRNYGASHARGKYLVFFDADVQISQNFLHLIQKYLNSKPVPFLTTRVRADTHHMYDEAIVRVLNLTMDVGLLVEHPFVGGYNFIILKGVFEAVGGFREEVVHAEDYDLSVRLHKAGYRPTILNNPTLVFSLRRFRHEGRLSVLQKNAHATLHLITKGPITKEIFSYPMGGLWYRLKKRENIRPQALSLVETRIKHFLHLFLTQ